MRRIVPMMLLVLAAAFSFSCGAKLNPNGFRIGEFGSLTGSQATFGISTQNGIQLAVDEINAAGGVNGKQLKVIVMDDRGKPDEAAVVVTKLITQDRVQIILGEVPVRFPWPQPPSVKPVKYP